MAQLNSSVSLRVTVYSEARSVTIPMTARTSRMKKIVFVSIPIVLLFTKIGLLKM